MDLADLRSFLESGMPMRNAVAFLMRTAEEVQHKAAEMDLLQSDLIDARKIAPNS